MEMNLVHSVAWKFWQKNPDLDYEDLLSEAVLAYCEAQKKFDPARGVKETTLAHTYMRNAITAWIRQERKEKNHLSITTEDGQEREFAAPCPPPVSEILQEMSKEAREVCEMILASPEEFAGFPPRVCRGRIYRELRNRGWSWGKIWNSFKEIKGALNENPYSAII